MPWFPDFVGAVELVRRQTRAAARADPVAQYFTALNEGDTSALETVWPGDPLHALNGGRVGQLDVLAHIVGGQAALAVLADNGGPSVAGDRGDDPGVAVGDGQVAVVAAGPY